MEHVRDVTTAEAGPRPAPEPRRLPEEVWGPARRLGVRGYTPPFETVDQWLAVRYEPATIPVKKGQGLPGSIPPPSPAIGKDEDEKIVYLSIPIGIGLSTRNASGTARGDFAATLEFKFENWSNCCFACLTPLAKTWLPTSSSLALAWVLDSDIQSRSAMPRYESMSASCCGKSAPVAYSVSRPTAKPNITHRPFPISFFLVKPNTLHSNKYLKLGMIAHEAEALHEYRSPTYSSPLSPPPAHADEQARAQCT